MAVSSRSLYSGTTPSGFGYIKVSAVDIPSHKNMLDLYYSFVCKFILDWERRINQFAQLSFQFPLELLILIWSLITNPGESTQQGFHCGGKMMDSFS